MHSEWTGERLETFVIGETTIEHLHRYAFALSLVQNKIILDLACGEGYGSNLLSESAQKVVGVDIDEMTIRNAIQKYKKANLIFEKAAATELPFTDYEFDVVVSFETLEHIEQHDQMLKEIKRVLRPDGLLIISTPDKKNYTEARSYKNPFHVKELYAEEFQNLLKENFKNVRYFQQSFVHGSLIADKNESSSFAVYSGDFEKLQSALPASQYWIAVASDADMPDISDSFFYNEKILEEIIKAKLSFIQNSFSFRLGNFLLSPFKWLRSKLKS